jgi:nicotinamidase-related amidase
MIIRFCVAVFAIGLALIGCHANGASGALPVIALGAFAGWGETIDDSAFFIKGTLNSRPLAFAVDYGANGFMLSDRMHRVIAKPISLRSRSDDNKPIVTTRHDWNPARIAVVICDMWNTTPCVSAARRVVKMAPRINEVAARLRHEGALIVHAPTSCMEYYDGTPARERARQAPRVASPVPVDWNEWNALREAPLSPALAEDTPCSCEPGEPCTESGKPSPWTRQIESIEILPTDAVTDDGDELYALLAGRTIDDVVVMGVHLNRCVLGRPYGIRQLVYWEKRPVLCRDLTDSYHRDLRGHLAGNEEMIAHVERYWCPTVTSDQLVGGAPFQFRSNG